MESRYARESSPKHLRRMQKWARAHEGNNTSHTRPLGAENGRHSGPHLSLSDRICELLVADILKWIYEPSTRQLVPRVYLTA